MSTTKIESASIEGVSASKLTGTIPADTLPPVLPAVDGSALTGVVSGGGGKVLQTVEATNAGQTGNSAHNVYAATGLTATITPSSVNSKIFILGAVVLHFSQPERRACVSVFRGSGVGGFDVASTKVMGGSGSSWDYGLSHASGPSWGSAQYSSTVTLPMVALDEPATTSPQQYTVGWKNYDSGLTSYYSINNSTSSIILMEIAQ